MRSSREATSGKANNKMPSTTARGAAATGSKLPVRVWVEKS